MINLVCLDCGSENITLDASARWNFEQQRYELADTHDHGICEKCQSESWAEIDTDTINPKTAA